MTTQRIHAVGRAATALCVAATLVACAAPSNSPSYGPRPVAQTAVQKAIGKCAISVGAGAILGAVVGGDSKGALTGALVGGAACAVFLQVASKEDQARLAAAEKAALEANRSNTRSFKTTKGKQAVVSTKVEAAPMPKAPARKAPAATQPAAVSSPKAEPVYTACRYATQTVTVDGQSSAAPKQLWCRVDTGDWQPVAG